MLFDEVCEVSGGSMFLMHEVYQDYVIGGIRRNVFIHDPLKNPPTCKRQDLVKVI